MLHVNLPVSFIMTSIPYASHSPQLPMEFESLVFHRVIASMHCMSFVGTVNGEAESYWRLMNVGWMASAAASLLLLDQYC